MGSSGFTSFSQYLSIGIFIDEPVQKLIRHQVGVPRGINADLGQHLVDDNLNMFVVYVHALRAVYLLHLVNQVLLGGFLAQNTQYIVGIY